MPVCDVVVTLAIDRQFQVDLRFCCMPLQLLRCVELVFGCHRISFKAFSNAIKPRSVCSTVPNGDADAAVAAGVTAAVSHQHSLPPHRIDKGLMFAADVHQDKVRVTWPIGNFQLRQRLLGGVAALQHLIGIPVRYRLRPQGLPAGIPAQWSSRCMEN